MFEGQPGVLPVPVSHANADPDGTAENIKQNQGQGQIERAAIAEVH
jgi:hypothetical protein